MLLTLSSETSRVMCCAMQVLGSMMLVLSVVTVLTVLNHLNGTRDVSTSLAQLFVSCAGTATMVSYSHILYHTITGSLYYCHSLTGSLYYCHTITRSLYYCPYSCHKLTILTPYYLVLTGTFRVCLVLKLKHGKIKFHV